MNIKHLIAVAAGVVGADVFGGPRARGRLRWRPVGKSGWVQRPFSFPRKGGVCYPIEG